MTAFAYSQNHEETQIYTVNENVLPSPPEMKTCILNKIVRQKTIIDINNILQTESTDKCNTVRCY